MEFDATTSTEAAPIAETSTIADPSDDGQSGLLPEKFRGPDGIAQMTKAYTEAEKELRRVQEEKAALAKEKEILAKEAERAKLLEEQLQKPTQTASAPTDDEIFRKEWEEDPAQAVLNQTRRAESRAKQISEDVSQKIAYDSAKKDSQNYPDFEKYEPTMVRLAQQYAPLMDREQLRNPAIIPLLYKMARAEHLPEVLESAEQRAQEKAAKQRAAKNAASAEGSGSTGARSAPAFQDLSLKEMENLLGFVER